MSTLQETWNRLAFSEDSTIVQLDEAHGNSKIYDNCQKGWKKHPEVAKGKMAKNAKGSCIPESDETDEHHLSEVDEVIEEVISNWNQVIQEDGFDKEKKDRMKPNKPRYLKKGEPGYGKKQKVVKATKKVGGETKEKIVKFGDADMRNNSDKPKNKANFRKRHNCSDKDDKFAPGYWACKDW